MPTSRYAYLAALLPVAPALLEESLLKLWQEAIPKLHGSQPQLALRTLRVSLTNAVDCLLLDVYEAPEAAPEAMARPSGLDAEAVRQGPFADCSFHVLWAKGRGVAMDWLPRERRLCELYHALLLEDEYLLDSFRLSPPPCRIFPVDPHASQPQPLVPLPWAPGEPLPRVTFAVSFHAYKVYSTEARGNPQRWLQDPDTWNRYFMELSRNQMLRICLAQEDCEGDQAPYRLMFWEDISSEFLDCIARGITPIWLGTPSIYEYVERNVLLTRWRFETPEEMMNIIQTLSSPEGILEYGTRVFMERQGNYFLSHFYWRQNPHLRALLLASAAQRQQMLQPQASLAHFTGWAYLWMWILLIHVGKIVCLSEAPP